MELVVSSESLEEDTASDSFLVVLADLAGSCLRAAVEGNISCMHHTRVFTLPTLQRKTLV